MIVTAPSRLHFGLLHVPVPGSTRPAFGGLGAMIESPQITVEITPQERWHFEGTLACRAKAILESMLTYNDHSPCKIIAHGPAEHTGLGVGTALSLAIVKALYPKTTRDNLIALAKRGERSRIGIRGFFDGGLLYDAGHGREESSRTIRTPDDWCFALLTPTTTGEWSGQRERDAFARSRSLSQAIATTAKLEELLNESLFPAAERNDFAAFACALGDYNRIAGEPFAADQGGPFASPEAERIISTLKANGFPGSGQSSWGPTLFVLLDHESKLPAVREIVGHEIPVMRARIAVRGAFTS